MSGETALNLFQQQEANRRRTALLVIGFVVFFAWLGFGGDYIYHLYTLAEPPTAYHHTFPWFGIALSLVAAVMAWYAYATGPEKVLWSTGAREVVDATDPKERQLVNVVEEMAIAAGVPRPRIWIVDDPDPNAFATGTGPLHAHIAVTQGLLDLCTRDELQAVIGHELGHVKNLDVRLMTTLAALVGAVALGVAVVAERALGISWVRALLLIAFGALALIGYKVTRANLRNGAVVAGIAGVALILVAGGTTGLVAGLLVLAGALWGLLKSF